MSEVLAQLEKIGKTEANLISYGAYTNGATINCKKGDIIVFICNTRGTGDTYTNMELLLYGPTTVMDGSTTGRMVILRATDDTCSANLSLWNSTCRIYHSIIR